MDGSRRVPEVNTEKLDEFVGKVIGDIGGSFAFLLSLQKQWLRTGD